MNKQRIYWSMIGLCLVISLAFFLRTKKEIDFLLGLHHQEVAQLHWMNQAVGALSTGNLDQFYPALSQITSDSLRQNLMRLFRQSLVKNEEGQYRDPMNQDWEQLYSIQEKLLKEKEWRLQYYSREIDSLSKYATTYAVEVNSAREYREQIQRQVDELSNEKIQLQQSMDLTKQQLPIAFDFVNRKGLKVSYFGESKQGKAHGYGIGFYNGGGVYRGYWEDNMRHGQGFYTWKNGDTYDGMYVFGERSGFGIYTFASGEKYKGNWKSDVREGYGELWDAEGNLQWKGQWQKDKGIK